MKKVGKLYLGKGSYWNQDDQKPKKQKFTRAQDDSPESTNPKDERRSSMSFEEIDKLYPGRFIDGNAELEREGISAFIIPGMGMKPHLPEQQVEEESMADEQDWKDFENGEEALAAALKKYNPPAQMEPEQTLSMDEYMEDHLAGLQEQQDQWAEQAMPVIEKILRVAAERKRKRAEKK